MVVPEAGRAVSKSVLLGRLAASETRVRPAPRPSVAPPTRPNMVSSGCKIQKWRLMAAPCEPKSRLHKRLFTMDVLY